MLKSTSPEAVEHMIVELISGNKRAFVQVNDLMSYPVVTVSSETRMNKVYAILEEKGHMGIPVLENGLLAGIISRRDFRKVRKRSGLKAPVKAFMSTNVVTIAPTESPEQAARLMVKYDIGRLPVVESGRVIGIIARSDILRFFYNLLPD